jgi:hypothetical protein
MEWILENVICKATYRAHMDISNSQTSMTKLQLCKNPKTFGEAIHTTRTEIFYSYTVNNASRQLKMQLLCR